jgi:hypothetical protein
MSKLTADDYAVIAAAFTAKGITPGEAFLSMKSSNFNVKVGDEPTYTGVYASRVMALMHKAAAGESDFVQL